MGEQESSCLTTASTHSDNFSTLSLVLEMLEFISRRIRRHSLLKPLAPEVGGVGNTDLPGAETPLLPFTEILLGGNLVDAC